MNKRYNNNLTLGQRFTITFVLLIFIPILILNLILAYFQYNRSSTEYINTHKYTLSNIPDTLSSDLSFAFKYASVVYNDYDINMFLNTKFTSATDFYDKYTSYSVKKLLDFYSSQSENIKTPIIFTDNPTAYASTDCLATIDKAVLDTAWYQAFNQSNKDTFLYFDSQLRYAYVLRNLNYNGMSMYNNFIRIDIDLDFVDNMLNASNIRSFSYLFGDTSTPIYSWNYGYTPKSQEKDYALLEKDTILDDLALVYSTSVDNYGEIRFIIILEKAPLFDTSIIVSTAITLFFTLFVAMIFMSSIQKNYIKRVEGLVSTINIDEYIKPTEKDDDKPKLFKRKSNNELKIVEDTMQEMSTKIHALIKESYALEMEKNQAEIRRKQSELNSLLSQINPHYLFNVLNAIRLKSIIKGEKETAKIILYVSKIMRQSITWNEDVITLGEEINFIQEYLAIEKYRFEDKLTYEINVKEQLLSCDIPKMCLQPFVENACVHGVQNVIGEGKITIDVTEKDEQNIIFSITNPTSDFSEEKKQQIIGYSKGNFDVDTKSVGLKNTFARLRYYYDSFDFTINLEQNQVTFTLILPKVTDNGKKKGDNE